MTTWNANVKTLNEPEFEKRVTADQFTGITANKTN